jgi:hypothetical protein
MKNETLSFYAISEDGNSFQRVSTTTVVQDLGPCVDAIRRITARTGQKVPFMCLSNGVPLHASIKASDGIVWGILPAIELNCNWTVTGDTMHPTFTGPGTRMKQSWTPPEGCRPFFFADVLDSAIPGPRRFKARQCYLVAAGKTPGWYRLPLPNTYADGTLCLGDGNTPMGQTLATVWENAVTMFFSAPFNSDLSTEGTGMPGTKALFTFKVTDNKPVPCPDWETKCTKVNSTVYDCV